jgi:hypothetical protein
MIVCSCDVFSDHQVRSVVAKKGARAPHERGLFLPRMQRPVRSLRSHHQADHGRKADLRLRSCERKHALKETLEVTLPPRFYPG